MIFAAAITMTVSAPGAALEAQGGEQECRARLPRGTCRRYRETHKWF
jgi:hypothetical protein